MRALIEYINDKGPDGLSKYASAESTARNGFVETLCSVYEFEVTHD